ncbi:uncharacterized protein STAUR_5223 [Stigmatella aurantiaca DW4/3-1]|uniref:Uncharacterized protein n=1 Tax=Stigmatella aurantiaca (strain DW4/3-1) TaxID=378806 RepID=E3FLA3_STIAD|nr:uncharacterized protein STAUR_5223 [Stigmatella aurantiaca DW4/3-1]
MGLFLVRNAITHQDRVGFDAARPLDCGGGAMQSHRLAARCLAGERALQPRATGGLLERGATGGNACLGLVLVPGNGGSAGDGVVVARGVVGGVARVVAASSEQKARAGRHEDLTNHRCWLLFET